jgi:hypothetical protein
MLRKHEKDVPLNLIETSFAYDETLHSRTIRLLRLLPGTGGEKLCCQLFKRRLCSPLRYKALSYAWGDTSDSRNVYCDNKVIKVTSNLFSALWQLREKETYEYLWVDAICINQLNLEEKTNQVRLMLDIFKRADMVIIWLGEQRETDRIAVNLAYQIYGAAQMVGFEKFARMVFRGQATAFPPVWTHHWRALWSLLDREWFARVWVVQEFVVAKGCTMLCGSLYFNAAILLHVALAVRDAQTPEKPLTIHVTSSLVMFKGQYLRDLPLPLIGMMILTRALQASDPRDKIFALVGIASDMSCDFIDYRKSFAEVNTEIIKQGLEDPEIKALGLHLLSYVRNDGSTGILPSWVPALSDVKADFVPLSHAYNSGSMKLQGQPEICFDLNVSLLHYISTIL